MNATTQATATRRAVLSAALALPAAGALAAVPAIAAAPVSRSAWDRALRTYERAKATSDAFDKSFWEIDRLHDVACKAIPHVETNATFPTFGGTCRALTTAKPADVAEARRMLHGLKQWGPDLNDYVAACREVVAAAEARRAEEEAIDARVGYSAANDQYDRLADAMADAEGALVLLPAPDTHALLWKLEALLGEDTRSKDDRSGSVWCGAWLDAVMDDARRLLSTEAQS